MNGIIASKLRDLARLRQLQGANSFSIRAYTNAANLIEELDTDIEDAAQLYTIDGIGDKIVSAVEEVIQTGTLAELTESSELLSQLRELTKVPGIGTKRAIKLIDMGIKTLPELREAITARKVKGGKKLLDSIAFAEMQEFGRVPVEFIRKSATSILLRLRQMKVVENAEITGSFRRGRSTVKDIDILVASEHPTEVVNNFLTMGDEIESGDRKASIYVWYTITNRPLRIRVDLMIVRKKSWGAALCHFTGSKEHNIRLRALAKKRGINVSQNGIIGPQGEWLGGEREKDLYEILGIEFIKPSDRKD